MGRTITLRDHGNFNNTLQFLKALPKVDWEGVLKDFAQQGVEALSIATPVDSGITANSWDYKFSKHLNGSFTIVWTNSSVTEDDQSIALLLQYGHGTGTGGWVQGVDFINPAIQSVFDDLVKAFWEKVQSL